jgi:hypothetical protein
MPLLPRVAVPLVLAACAAAAPATASAQKSASHPVGDTLHFTLSSKINVDMDAGAMGAMNAASSSDLQIALQFGKGDTLVIWVEKAAGHASSPAGEQDLDVSKMLNKPTILTLSPAGEFKTVKAADLLGDDDSGIAALLPDDESFGLELKHPAGPLRKGMTWTDTTDRKPKPDASQKMTSHIITTYIVAGDSVIAGKPVVILDAVAAGDVMLDMPIAGGQMTMQSKSKTDAKSRVYYSPDMHIVLMNVTTGTGEGTQNIEGPMSITMTTKQKIDNTMKLVQ